MSFQHDFLNLPLNSEPVHLWIKAFGHENQLGSNPDEVLFEGKLRSIREVSSEIFDAKKGKISSDWRYDHRGFTKTSYIKFSQLTPTHQYEADGSHYFVVKSKEKGFWGSGRHCYMELIDAHGQGFNFGLCGPTSFPFHGTQGAIVSPDPKVASTGFERSTKIQITQEVFDKVLARINHDKKNGHEYFHLIKNNCSKYVSTISKEELGITMNNKEYLSQVLGRRIFRLVNFKPGHKLSKVLYVIAGIARAVLAPFYALCWLVTGSCFDDKKGKLAKAKQFKNKLQRPFIKSAWKVCKKFFSCDAVKIATGWKISLWQDKIKEKFSDRIITLEEARSVAVEKHTVI